MIWNRVKAGASRAATISAFLLLCLGIERRAEAATYRVPGNFSTIQAAANAVNPGDTVLVAAGTYNEKVTITRSGTASAPIVFQSETRRGAKMQGWDLNAAYITVKSFEITGTSGNAFFVRKDGAVIDDNYMHDLSSKSIQCNWKKPFPNNGKVTNNYMYSVGSGIIVIGDNWLVENNEVRRLVQRVSGDCDYTRVSGNGNIIRGNKFWGTSFSEIGSAHVDGFQTYDNNGEFLQNCIFENNFIADCHQGMQANGNYYKNSFNNTFRNNIFTRCSSWGLNMHYMRDVYVYNNIFYNMPIHSLGARTGSQLTIKNNIFYNAGSVYFADSGASVTASNNLIYFSGKTTSGWPNNIINLDPQFVNLSGEDFHLKSTSPAIDKGVNVGLTKDKDGAPRPQGAGYDIGPYEFGGSTPPPATPALSVSDVSVNEGNSGTVIANFNVTLSAASAQTVTVNYATADGTAKTSDADYTAANGTLSIPAGTTSKTVAVIINGDTRVESDETLMLNLTSPTNATLADAQGVGTIKNDDVAVVPAASVTDVAVAEGNGTDSQLVFNVTLSQAPTQTVSVNYATSDGTATVADGDYTAASGTLSIGAGTTSKTIVVAVKGDTRAEGNETVNLNLSSPVGCTISTPQAKGTIQCDDAVTNPDGMVAHLKLDETSGTTAADASGTGNNATVSNCSWAAGTLDGAVNLPGSGYVQTPTLNWSAQKGSVAMWVYPKAFPAKAQFLFGHTTSPSWGNRIQIYTNDAAGNLCLGMGGSHSTATNVAVLAVNRWQHVALTWDGTNYKLFVDGVQKATGTYSGLTRMNTLADFGNNGHIADRTEPFNGMIDDARVYNRALSDADVLGLVQSIAAPQISIADTNGLEGNSGTSNKDFTVSLSRACATTVTVNYATSDETATAGSDYTAKSGQVTFPAGSTTQTISVPVVGDTTFERNETFLVTLSNPVNATLADNQAVARIGNDDAAPELKINDVSVAEGNSGTKTVQFTVSLSAVSEVPVSASVATANGTATAGSDYVAASSTIAIPAGSTSATFSVTINGDTTIEPNETFTVSVTNPLNATILDGQGVGTITNDDGATSTGPTISISDATVVEGNSGTKWIAFNITLSKAATSKVSVYYTTANGTATAPSDYIAEAGTISFNPGVVKRTVSVAVVGDTVREANEAFQIQLSNAVNATIVDATAVGNITNND